MTLRELSETNGHSVVGDFDALADQMRGRLRELELRANARTRDLQAAADVAKQTATLLSLDELLPQVVELTKERFNLYHAHIYLLDSLSNELVLAAGAGEPGRQMVAFGHTIDLNLKDSIVARTGRDRQPQLINDVANTPGFLPNALLPNTKAEMGVPMVVGDRLVGVLDVQSDVVNHFTEDDVLIMTSLGDQIAVAVENARAFEQTRIAQQDAEFAQAEAELLYRISEKINRALTPDDLLQAFADYAGGYGAHSMIMLYFDRYQGKLPEMLEIVATLSLDGKPTIPVGSRFDLSSYPFSQMLFDSPNAPVLIPNVATEERLDPTTRDYYVSQHIVANALLPLNLRGQWIGLVSILWEEPYAFTEQDVRIYGSLARQAATAVDLTRQFEQTQAALQEVQDLQFAIDEAAIVAITDVTGKIIYANDRFCQISKYSREELLGQDHRIINSGHHSKEFIRDLWVTIANGKVWQGELRNKAKDGSIYWVDTTIVPLLDANGKPRQYIAIRYEITERKRQEEALRANETQLQSILDNSSAVIYVKDVEGKYLTINRAYENLFHVTRDGIVGKTDQDIFPPDVAAALREADANIIKQNEVTELEEYVPQDDGLHTYISVKFPLRDEDGQPYAVGGISTDITPIRATAQQAQRRAAELETVVQVSAAASTILDVEELLYTVSDLAKERFDLYHAHVYLLSDDGKTLRLTAGAGETGRRMVSRNHQIPVNREHSLVARCARTLEPVIANDVRIEPDFLPNPELPGTRSELAVPMMVGGRLIGVLDVQADAVSHFGPDEARIQGALASQIAVAVNNARLFQQTEARLRDVQISAQIAEYMRSDAPLDDTLEQTLEYVTQAMGADNAFFARWDDERDGIVGVIATGPGLTREYARTIFEPASRVPHVAEAVKTEQVVAVDDAATYPGFPLDYVEVVQIKSVLVMPIFSGSKVSGVVIFNYGQAAHQFTREEIALARNISNQLSVGIERKQAAEQIRLYADVVNNSPSGIYVWQLDDLDGDLNEFRVLMANEASRASTLRDPAEVIGKTVNQTFPTLINSPILSIYRDVIVNRQTVDLGESEFVNDFGEYRTYSIKVFPLPGNVAGASFEDVTERKRNQDEIRVRAEEIEIISEIGAEIATNLNLDVLLLSIANTVKERFGRYYAHIYTYDAQTETLVLRAGAGEIGKQLVEKGHSIPLDHATSIVARAGRDREPVVVNDVTQSEHFLPNKLLPDTRSELAIPIISGDELLGVLDIQDSKVNVFSDVQINAKVVLANQIAVAMQNAATFEAQQALQEEIDRSRVQAELVSRVNTSLSRATDENSMLHAVTRLEMVNDISLASISYTLGGEEIPSGIEVMAIQSAGGEVVPLEVLPSPTMSAEEYPLFSLVLANPREVLFIEDIMSDERVDENIRASSQALNIASAVLVPLFTQNHWQGLLILTWAQPRTFDARFISLFRDVRASFAAVLATRRAFREIVAAQQVIERRASEMETVAQVSAATTTILDVETLLKQVSDLTKERFDLYHAHVYLLDEAGQGLVLSGGAGMPGDLMKSEGHVIPLTRENSIVARAGRTMDGVISNDVTADAFHLPNPLLPETRSELAVPMIVAGRLVGVLDVQSKVPGRFKSEDQTIMRTLADQVAVAVENARQFEETQRQAERERETAERLREVDRLKSQFLANMSHELRTPLNSIIGYSEVLLDGVDGELEEEAVEDVNAIHSSGKHLLAIINEILDLAKIEARQMQLDLESVELPKLVQEIVRSGQILTKDKPVVIEMVEENPIGTVSADKIRLRQIIWNLLSNAVKFTEKGSVKVCYGRVDDEMGYVKVVDTGVGIASDKLHTVFERFSQVDGSSTRRAGGTGLGLTITQQLVHMHGGEIEVESEFGVGSTFSFTIPLYKEAQPA